MSSAPEGHHPIGQPKDCFMPQMLNERWISGQDSNLNDSDGNYLDNDCAANESANKSRHACKMPVLCSGTPLLIKQHRLSSIQSTADRPDVKRNIPVVVELAQAEPCQPLCRRAPACTARARGRTVLESQHLGSAQHQYPAHSCRVTKEDRQPRLLLQTVCAMLAGMANSDRLK